MMKTRSLLAALACAALACASAFAAPPPTASPGPGFDRAEIQAVRQDVSPVSLTVAESGTGAASAFKAFEAQRQGAQGLAPRTMAQWQRMYPEVTPSMKLTPTQRDQLLQVLYPSRYGAGGSGCVSLGEALGRWQT